MEILRLVEQWLQDHQADLIPPGVDVTVSPPSREQSKKTIVITASSDRFSGDMIWFETGECEFGVVDLESPPSIPVNEAGMSESRIVASPADVDRYFRRFLSQFNMA